ncbi:Prefoldin subunit 3 [Penicillium atrosanguineum]|uniref:Uncharacterized protein n=1 Tax=Penicillium atrosanguineum TaxID=1132637 RepID=A0A9W9U1M6_9EURO|nr:Prefoldin subunit 3 [Penicillium atrosanguineum]KAJ5290055.1 Prefoldin subunit 3 [Penicillium atrosanguineum]KAJ5307878.1 hypothetical protein N7476_008534 [Penicillium atrosanguineum]
MASAIVLPPGSHDYLLAEKPKVPEKPHHVQTTLTFNKEMEDGSPHPPIWIGKPETNERPMITIPAIIHDVSGHELDYTLDSHGFQFHYHESKLKDFLDDEEIRAEYYPEMEQLLKDITGASRFFIFDHTIRRAPKDWISGDQPRGPVHTVHIDTSYAGAEARVVHQFRDEAPELLKARYQIISVWRPIRTILKHPLAVADAKSSPDNDLSPIKFIYPEREGGWEGGAWSVKANPNIKWYYRYKQTPNMVTFIKFFDSKVDGRARRVPHGSFVDPETEHEAARESIEVRALCFHPEDRD